MISSVTLDLSLNGPVEIFEVPATVGLKDLLDRLGLEKGEGGANFQLHSAEPRIGNERYPSDLLLRRLSDSNDKHALEIVGALSHGKWDSLVLRDFAIYCSEPALVAKAREIGQHTMQVHPDVPGSVEAYLLNVAERTGRYPE